VALLAPADPSGPVERARDIAALERELGLFVEPALHGWAAPHGTLMAALGCSMCSRICRRSAGP
jgi:hypothetical protein